MASFKGLRQLILRSDLVIMREEHEVNDERNTESGEFYLYDNGTSSISIILLPSGAMSVIEYGARIKDNYVRGIVLTTLRASDAVARAKSLRTELHQVWKDSQAPTQTLNRWNP